MFLGDVLCFMILFQRAEDMQSLEKTKLEGPSMLEKPGDAILAKVNAGRSGLEYLRLTWRALIER